MTRVETRLAYRSVLRRYMARGVTRAQIAEVVRAFGGENPSIGDLEDALRQYAPGGEFIALAEKAHNERGRQPRQASAL